MCVNGSIVCSRIEFALSDPNHMYGSDHKNIVQYTGKEVNNQSSNNNADSAKVSSQLKGNKGTLKADRSLYTDAKFRREKKLRDTLLNREIMAKVTCSGPITKHLDWCSKLFM